MSRHDMLEWVNASTNGKYKKIEELCNGVAYCLLMEQLFPRSVGLKKIKLNPKMEHEFVHNLKLFQSAFTRSNIEKSVPIDKLMKARFQDNFEFLQWFKKFYDAHANGKENGQAKPNLKTFSKTKEPNLSLMRLKIEDQPENSIPELTEKVEKLTAEHQKIWEQCQAIEAKRDMHYEKLLRIEHILIKLKEEGHMIEFCNKSLKILYEEKEPNDQERHVDSVGASLNNDK